ncbi:DUF4145 domain-containing protein [Phyllobacterium sp. P5_D12]
MKCPHCSVTVHMAWVQRPFVGPNNVARPWDYRSSVCPACEKIVLEYGLAARNSFEITVAVENWSPIEPKRTNRDPVPKEVPSTVAYDYIEACNVLNISPKASAALSRRCLQAMLRAHNYIAKDLAKEIDLLINETDTTKAVPPSLRATVDGIRNFGNFSAHPITDVTTLQVIDVDPEEAEWCLEVLEECFTHFYVNPARAAARKLALDTKLANAGKPPSKG